MRATFISRWEKHVAGQIVGTVKDGVAQLLYDNEARRNAISIAMSQQAAELLEKYAVDPEVRLLVIAGAGDKSFISGADISEFEKTRKDPETAAAYSQLSTRMYTLVHDFPKPTIAKIRGFCFGGGMGLAAACDLRFASDDSLFSIPAARLGISYRLDFLSWLNGIVGAARTREMLITARRYKAREALAMGLVHQVAPVAEFEKAFEDYLAPMKENAPLSMAASKQMISALANPLAPIDREKLKALSTACLASEDYKEGRTAFMEKRRPVFRGR